MIILYRSDVIGDLEETLTIWRECAVEIGFPGLHIVCARTFDYDDSLSYLFDATVEFPPHATRPRNIANVMKGKAKGFQGFVHSYLATSASFPARDYPDRKVYRAVMPRWDNTPRRGSHSRSFIGATPDLYGNWLKHSVEKAKKELPPNERFVFINAWNEWAEGAVLEPSVEYGRSYLTATKLALQPHDHRDQIIEELSKDGLSKERKAVLLREFHDLSEFEAKSIEAMRKTMLQMWFIQTADSNRPRKQDGPAVPVSSRISDGLQRWPAVHRACRRVYRALNELVQ